MDQTVRRKFWEIYIYGFFLEYRSFNDTSQFLQEKNTGFFR
jgi:hypothetical protein